MTETELRELRPFLDERMRLKALPARRRKKLAALWLLSERFEAGRTCSEGEVNDLLDEWTVIHDPATLRREMFDLGLLNRTSDCRSSWKESPAENLTDFIAKNL